MKRFFLLVVSLGVALVLESSSLSAKPGGGAGGGGGGFRPSGGGAGGGFRGPSSPPSLSRPSGGFSPSVRPGGGAPQLPSFNPGSGSRPLNLPSRPLTVPSQPLVSPGRPLNFPTPSVTVPNPSLNLPRPSGISPPVVGPGSTPAARPSFYPPLGNTITNPGNSVPRVVGPGNTPASNVQKPLQLPGVTANPAPRVVLPGTSPASTVQKPLPFPGAAGNSAALRVVGPGNTPDVRSPLSPGWQNALNKTERSTSFFRNGDRIAGVDLSNNLRFQNLRANANLVNQNLRPQYQNWFHSSWWNNYPGRWPWWHYHRYPRPAAFWWRPLTWVALGGFYPWAATAAPIYYDYGVNLYPANDMVYLNDEPVASFPGYIQQALDLADVQPPTREETTEWLPVGTFALSAQKDEKNPNIILQLALDPKGRVSGTWYDRAKDIADPVEGQVNSETQRVALRRPSQPDVVLEVGLYNLTLPACSCLLHLGNRQSQIWYLTRLEGMNSGP